MLSTLLLICIVVWIANYIRAKNYDARFQYGQEIAESLDLKEVFENAYLGSFAFGEAPPNESIREETEYSFDMGVESRLALHFVRNLPKWVLESCAKDIKVGTYKCDASYAKYIEEQIEVFTSRRNAELVELLNKKASSSPEPRRMRRRRR